MFTSKKYEKYDFIVSLGAVCSCSATLRSKNLQDYSYPFDWLCGSTLKDRCNMIINSFDGWLNIEDLKFFGQRTSPAPCDIYKNEKTNIIYNHDFCINIPLQQTYKEVFTQYERRIKRMLDNINNSNNICFVYIESAEIEQHYSFEYLQECYNILNQHFAGKNIILKYIYNSKKYSYIQNKNIEIISDDYSVKTPQAQKHEADIQVLANLFKNVKLKRKFTLKRFLQFFISCRVTQRADWKRYNIRLLGLKFQFTKNIKYKTQGGVHV